METNNFAKWKNKELKKWLLEYEDNPSIRNEKNKETYKEIVKESFKRTGGDELYRWAYFSEINPEGTIQSFKQWVLEQ
jgi:hypothetical protein